MTKIVSICGAILLAGCSDACQNDVVSEATSPDGRFVAVIFQRDCGATSGFSTQISVLAAGERPTRSGNIFVADDNHGAAAVGGWGGPWARVKWLGPNRLQVTYAKGSRVFDQTEKVGGVTVSFGTKTSQ